MSLQIIDVDAHRSAVIYNRYYYKENLLDNINGKKQLQDISEHEKSVGGG